MFNKLNMRNKHHTKKVRGSLNLCVVFFLFSSLLSGLILLLLFMNGTLWESSSSTNYQYNATGIALFIILLLIGLVVICAICIMFLVMTSSPIFTVEDLESIVHSAVNDFNLYIANQPKHKILQRAVDHFDDEIIEHYNKHSLQEETLIDAQIVEELLNFIHERFTEAYPDLIIPDGRWAYNVVGGIYARQKILLANFKEYICLWGSPLPQSGFSGYFPWLNEGDVMIKGTVRSSDPESALSAYRKYEFGDTSYLKNGHRRHYTMSPNCYMASFAVHKDTQMILTFWPGIKDSDWKSFWIQIFDACKGIRLWIMYRLAGGA